MKICILGSCSGTEPFPNRHHTAFSIETGEQIYWFDAGESCSHTAYTMGVDLLNVSHIFISHPHMDHVGGLCNLLWTIRKLTKVKKEHPKNGDVRVYMPSMKTWEGVLSILEQSEGGYQNDYRTVGIPIEDGVLLDTPKIRVTARHNAHLKETEPPYHSFSFLIEAKGKRIVYSGDVKDLSELAPLLGAGCDLLLTETGHHDPAKICSRIAQKELGEVRSLRFLHHGRRILDGHDEALAACQAILPQVIFSNDGDTFEL